MWCASHCVLYLTLDYTTFRKSGTMVSKWLCSIFLSLIVYAILRYHWKRRKLYKLANSLQGPPTLPLIGNALDFAGKEEELFEKVSKLVDTYASPVRVWLGPKLILVLKTAPDMEKILTSPKANDKDDIYRFMKVFNGIGLFTTNGAEWKKQRRYVTPFLGHKYMESYFKVIKENSTTLVKKIEVYVDKNAFLIEHYLCRCCNDIVTEVLMGFKPYAQDGKINHIVARINRAYVLLHSRMLKLWLHPDFLFRISANGKEQLEARNVFRGFVQQGTNLINQSRNKNKATNETECVSVLENLMDTRSKNPQFYGDQNLPDQIATLYSASEDTVTSICSYLCVLLGMYPDIQNKLVCEITDVLGSTGKDVEYKDLAEMKYLDMCVKEVIRLFPIGPYILRKLKEDLQLGDRILPKDCTVALSFFSVQRNPEYWEKPNEFYPDHFLPEAVSGRHPYAFLPFSAGARSCPGQLFAYIAIKTIAVTILQHYVLEADGTLQTMRLKADISIRPVKPHRLRIKRRVC